MPTYEGVLRDEGGAVFNVRSATYGGTYSGSGDGDMTNPNTVFAAVLAAVPDGACSSGVYCF